MRGHETDTLPEPLLDAADARGAVGATGGDSVGRRDPLRIEEDDRGRRHHALFDRPCQPLVWRVAAAVRPALVRGGTPATALFARKALVELRSKPAGDRLRRRKDAERRDEVRDQHRESRCGRANWMATRRHRSDGTRFGFPIRYAHCAMATP